MADVDQHEATHPPPKTFAELSLGEAREIFKNLMAQILRENLDLRKASVDAIRSEAVSEAVDELMKKTGDNREDLLLKALTLYKAAVDAARKGQRLALLGQDYQFIREIIGLEEPTSGKKHRESVSG
jgi:hypothetical protein